MPTVQTAALAFLRQFFPDALHADLSVMMPTGDGRGGNKRYTIPVPTLRTLAA